ncbi:tripartite tricarboxylate transporter substrate binding protein [Rhizobium sp. P32RR-XVIII]|uniref:Bug family tripartite tricarboxylate transporter substrate binding protein n=1 Tax=Rhizobium sp. P32RR-XVIII TaxID=2726738 RepID=UPI001456C3A1|nr:tripartite tricarboxylate transporter substrate binding protein [Rhizobium sp. P32RR-XVIII]NLS07578.1 tripartite tricarboxylate transporter substrate binding protein [Rhizobium sp. P32RR-XVIII]
MTIRFKTFSIAAMLVALATGAVAEDFKPTGLVSVVVHAGAGGGNDTFGRALLAVMEKENLLPVRFQVINKVGGGSANAMNYMAEKAGDNNTIGLFTSVYMINPLVQEEATTTMGDLTPIANLIFEPALVVVRTDSPFKTLKEFIDAAKAEPNKYSQSGGSVLSREAIVRQLIMSKTGAQWSFISFPTAGERISAVLGGHTDLMMIEPSEEAGLVKGGKLRVLAQIATKRLEDYPDVPTLKEAGYDIVDVPQARGVIGPPGMSKEAMAYYQDLFERASKSEGWKKYLRQMQLESAYMPAGELADFVKTYTSQIREILTSLDVKVVR